MNSSEKQHQMFLLEFSSFEQHSSKDSLPGEVSSPCTLFGQLNKTKQNKAVVLEKKLQVP